MIGIDATVLAICIISGLVFAIFIIGLLCGSDSARVEIIDIPDSDRQKNGDIPISEVDFSAVKVKWDLLDQASVHAQ